jgi:hypothetical protein
VATFDSVMLDLSASGAVLMMTERASSDWIEAMPSGVTATFSRGSKGIVLGGLSQGHSLDELPILSRDVANTALDLLSVRSVGSHALESTAFTGICWSLAAAGSTVRIANEMDLTFTARAGGGPAASAVSWHDSMRFFRFSQTSTDLFDSFRNLYLALESILSHICPMQLNRSGGPGEGESRWTLRALREAETRLQGKFQGMDMSHYLPSGQYPDPAQAVFDELYVQVRTRIFHAKRGRPFLIPQDQAERDEVVDAITRFSTLYSDLAELEFGARFLRTGLGKGGFAASARPYDPMALVLGDQEIADPNEFSLASNVQPVVLSTSRMHSLEQPYAAIWRGQETMANLPAGLVLRSTAALIDGRTVAAEPLGGELTLDGFHVLEAQMTYRAWGGGYRWKWSS